MKYHSSKALASDPMGIGLHKPKLKVFKKELGFFERLICMIRRPDGMINEHLQIGDSRAAVVVAAEGRLVVAAYTDELDCVALLEFPRSFIDEYNLKVGDRLLTINTYWRLFKVAKDLTPGQYNLGNYTNYYPIIAEFVSEEVHAIEWRKEAISDDEWDRVKMLAEKAYSRPPRRIRSGNPYRSDKVGGA